MVGHGGDPFSDSTTVNSTTPYEITRRSLRPRGKKGPNVVSTPCQTLEALGTWPDFLLQGLWP